MTRSHYEDIGGWHGLAEEDDSLDDELNAAFEADSARDRARRQNYRPKYDSPRRRSGSDREDSFNLMLWLAEGATGVIEEIRHSDLGLSEDFWVHAGAARRESLLAVRALIDQLLGEEALQAEKERTEEPPRPQRGGINVDF